MEDKEKNVQDIYIFYFEIHKYPYIIRTVHYQNSAFISCDCKEYKLIIFHSVTKSWTTYGAHIDWCICSAFTWILSNG